MVNLDLQRAEKLLKGAKTLYQQNDFSGVAGLAYQSLESAIIGLTSEIGEANSGTHQERLERAKKLLKSGQDKIDFLWDARNIDFYGNVKRFEPKRELTPSEVKEVIETVEDIIRKIKDLILSAKNIS